MEIDHIKGKKIAELLYHSFLTKGIFGQTIMPEDLVPIGIDPGSRKHLLFITLTVAIDYQRDATALWNSSRHTYEDAATCYLFEPAEVVSTPLSKVINDMQKHKLSKKPNKDALIWATISETIVNKFHNDPRNILKAGEFKGDRILELLRKSKHMKNGRWIPDFPYLSGNKIGPLWVRMLRDNLGYDIANMELIPIPVDVHVARATLTLGIVRGKYSGHINELFNYIRQAWFESVKGLKRSDGLPMIALDVDESLWHLSRGGCTKRHSNGYCSRKAICLCRDFCIPGEIELDSTNSQAKVNT